MTPPVRTSTKIKRGLLILWLLLVAGLPLYYLMPDRDWNYEYWGAPEQIVKSRMRRDNPWRQDEGVYTRIFIARPSAEHRQHFRECPADREDEKRLHDLLQQYELPGPYRYGDYFGHGWVDVVECSNRLLLVADYSRNKGGLFSSRMEWDTVMEHYPLHFRILYCWATLGVLILLLTPFLAVSFGFYTLILRVARAFWRMR